MKRRLPSRPTVATPPHTRWRLRQSQLWEASLIPQWLAERRRRRCPAWLFPAVGTSRHPALPAYLLSRVVAQPPTRPVSQARFPRQYAQARGRVSPVHLRGSKAVPELREHRSSLSPGCRFSRLLCHQSPVTACPLRSVGQGGRSFTSAQRKSSGRSDNATATSDPSRVTRSIL